MILFLYGEDSYRSRLKLHEIRNQFIKKHGIENIANFEFGDDNTATFHDLQAYVQEPSFFAKSQMAVAFNLIEKTSFLGRNWNQKLDALVEQMTKDDYFWLVIWERLSEKKIKKIGLANKAINQSKVNISEYRKPSVNELKKIGLLYVQKHNKEIENSVLHTLASKSSDSAFFYNGLDKLITFVGSRMKITQDDMKILKFPLQFENVFDVIEATNNRKRAQLYLILKKHYHLFRSEPLALLGLIVSQVRKLLIVNDMKLKRMDESAIIKKSKIKSFPLQKILGGLKNYQDHELKKIYNKLSNLDVRVKTGDISPDELLDLIPLVF